MITAEGLIHGWARNSNYFHTHLDGLTQVDALLQPPARGNCILWIVGHILRYRNYALRVLGQPAVVPEEAARRFARGSAPVLGEEDGLLQLEALVRAYDAAQQRIITALRALSPEAAVEVVTESDTTLPRAELIVSYMRHESYHAGQLELLREIALQQRAAR